MGQSADVPSGTVTLLFTDIQGSTRLWDAEPERMAAALRRHDGLLRTAIESAGGYVFKTVGDAFCAAFWTPEAAVTAALAAQRALTAEIWPTTRPLLVRMGLHTGACEERDGDYFGPVVNRVARLEAVAHGGQVLLSGATAELAGQTLAEGVGLRDLGLHRLKDLGRPEHVFQLEAPTLPSSFPALPSLDNPEFPNNLPAAVSPLIGRERELAEVGTLVRQFRLVTLTGAGGSGKTRLALQAAVELIDTIADGVWLVDLAPVTDGAQIPAVVAAVLGLPDQAGPGLTEAVTDALAAQDTLLLLDNCEHLVDAAAKFCDQVMRFCRKVRFLATSREPLGIDGERVYRVPSLSLPEPDAGSVADLAGSDAVRLFAERAAVHQPSFAIDSATAPLIATICRRLDGIPLALELAAARLSSMSLQQVTERLDQRFRLLTGGARNAMPRQQTLQATVDWSFSLLTPPERRTLTRLSVFAGGFGLDAAEKLCAAAGADPVDVADLVGSLVSKSLVVADHDERAVRYRLLETIRQYAAQELLRTGGEEAVAELRTRHAEYYRDLAEAARPVLTRHGQAACLRRLDPEWDNLRAALAHLQAERRPEDVLLMGVALERFAISRGHTDLLAALRAAIVAPGVRLSALLVEALIAVSRLTWLFARKDVAELVIAKAQAAQALALARELGDMRLEARALGQLASATWFEHDLAAVRHLASEGASLATRIGDMQLLGELLAAFAAAAPTPEDVRAIHLEVLACCRRSGDDQTAANALHQLYGLDLHAGLIENAAAYLHQAIRLAEQLGGDLFLYFLRSDLAILLLIQDDPSTAEQVVRRCLLVARRIGVRIDAAEVLFAAACCARWRGDYDRAARLHGAADADMKTALEIGTIGWSAAEAELHDRDQRQLREQLGQDRFELAYSAGQQLTPAQAVEFALSRA